MGQTKQIAARDNQPETVPILMKRLGECRLLAQNGPSKFCGEGLMLRAERTWRGRCLRVTRVTPLTFYPEWMVQVAHQGAGAPQVHGGLGRAFARNYVRRNSLAFQNAELADVAWIRHFSEK